MDVSRGSSLCTELLCETSHQQQDSSTMFWSQWISRMAKNLCWCYRIKEKKGGKKSQYLKSRLDQTNLPGFTPILEGFAEQDARALVQPHTPRLGQDTPSASQQHLLKVCGSSASKVTTWCGPLSSTKQAPTLLMDVISGRHFWVNERRKKNLKIQLSEFGAEYLICIH